MFEDDPDFADITNPIFSGSGTIGQESWTNNQPFHITCLEDRFRAILVCIIGSQQQWIENAIEKKTTMTPAITSTNTSN
jgi:hypothetical protein